MIDRDSEIVKAYSDDREPTRVIADRHGISTQRVRQILRRMGTPRRPPGRMRQYDYDHIVELYEELGSTTAVAERVGCAPSTVRHALDARGIPYGEPAGPVDTEEVLTLYVVDGLTQDAIAERLGISQAVVSSRIRRAGLTPDDRGSGAP